MVDVLEVAEALFQRAGDQLIAECAATKGKFSWSSWFAIERGISQCRMAELDRDAALALAADLASA